MLSQPVTPFIVELTRSASRETTVLDVLVGVFVVVVGLVALILAGGCLVAGGLVIWRKLRPYVPASGATGDGPTRLGIDASSR